MSTPPGPPRLSPPVVDAGATPGADAILDGFLRYVAALGLSLYPAQEEAVMAILDGKHVVLATPTGSGKSLVAAALLYQAFATGRRGFYGAPVKALSNEKFFWLCELFGAAHVGLVTGDASVNRDAPILCGTVEVLAQMAVRLRRPPADAVVLDEFHYYGDRERGLAWQLPLLALPSAQFLLMSGTLGDTRALEQRIEARTGRGVARVDGMTRPVPLEMEYRETPLHETIAELVAKGRAPVYLVNFTQRAAAEEAQSLTSVELCDKPEKEAIRRALAGVGFDSPYGKTLERLLRHGVGLHHAGLLPRYRRAVERLAQQGLLKVVSGTDTLGVGVNVPIRTVLFTQLCKFDGEHDVILPVREFHQIAGRAGRAGFDDRGYAAVQAPAHVIENLRLRARAAAGKKVSLQRPPQKGYVPWDRRTFERLRDGAPEPLESRFSVSHGLLVAALQSERGDPARGGGYRVLLELIAAAHDGPGAKRRHRRAAAACYRVLERLHLVERVRDERARNPYPALAAGLDDDFSLHHALSLYLVETLERLDRDAPGYALDVLSLVEAILENPRPILQAQLAREKTAAVEAMRAAGVPYEERLEELDKIEWPKPNRDFIYETFDAFAERHPWVGQDNVAPKGIARELVEGYASFHDYVRALGVERSEGVLLRYLGQVWRTLDQALPLRFVTPAVEELRLALRGLVEAVDTSLFDEWAAQTGAGTATAHATATIEAPRPAPAPRDPLADPRAFAARVRAELHRLLAALARKQWDEAAVALRGDGWTPERLRAALAPYFAEHAAILITPAARAPRNTVMKQVGPRVFDLQQRLCAPPVPGVGAGAAGDPGAGDDGGEGTDWAISARVDLSGGAPPFDGPLVELVRVGV